MFLSYFHQKQKVKDLSSLILIKLGYKYSKHKIVVKYTVLIYISTSISSNLSTC